jgi:predicted dehydrogenase
MTIRVGIIGCGMIARFHVSALEKAKASIRWACDPKSENASRLAARTGATATADWRAVLADPEVDAVVVATVSRLHKEICLAAVAAGKAVICEKTLTENAEDSWQVVAAAEAAGVPFFTSYMKRWFEATQQAKRLLPSLGRILSTHARSHQPWGDTWKGAQPPRGDGSAAPAAGGTASFLVSNYGGGILVMGGSHLIDLVLFLLGRPRRLYALQHIPGERDYDLHASALMESADHGSIHFEALASPLGRSGFLRDGWDEQVEITGTAGKLTLLTPYWSHVEHKTALLIHDDEATGQRHEYRYAVESPFDRAVAAFVADIAAGTQTAQSRITGYEVDQVIATMVASARAGQPLVVPWRS